MRGFFHKLTRRFGGFDGKVEKSACNAGRSSSDTAFLVLGDESLDQTCAIMCLGKLYSFGRKIVPRVAIEHGFAGRESQQLGIEVVMNAVTHDHDDIAFIARGEENGQVAKIGFVARKIRTNSTTRILGILNHRSIVCCQVSNSTRRHAPTEGFAITDTGANKPPVSTRSIYTGIRKSIGKSSRSHVARLLVERRRRRDTVIRSVVSIIIGRSMKMGFVDVGRR